MRVAFAHTAMLDLDGDHRAPGAAITLVLCGAIDHDDPCPLAPHHTTTRRMSTERLEVRTLFATEAHNEPAARARIVSALHKRSFAAPDGSVTNWSVIAQWAEPVADDERDLAARLCAD